MKYRSIATTLSLMLVGGIAVAGTGSQTAPPPPKAAVDLFFDTDSAQLDNLDATKGTLEPIAKWAKCHRKSAVILEAHADPRGAVEHNAKLAAERAETVRAQLIGMGVTPGQIVVTVYGEAGPKRESLAEDRRVTAKLDTELMLQNEPGPG